MRNQSIRKIVLSGMFLALGLVLPFLTGQIPSIGSRLLPMHIPVLLCGFVCGWPYGLLVGIIVPVFRSLLFGMPPMYPVAIAMAFELAAYGALTGLLYKMLPKNVVSMFISLIVAMIGGRIIWGIASLILIGAAGNQFTFGMFIAGGFVNALPGIILQLVLIPAIVLALKKAGYLEVK